MAKLTEILSLIRTMHRTEKAFFKKFSSRHVIEGKNYSVILFDAIERLKTDDGELIKKSAKMSDKQLANYKTILFGQILRSLRYYEDSKGVERKVANIVQEVQILMDRGLDYQAMKELAKAEKICAKYGLDYQLLSVHTKNCQSKASYDILFKLRESDIDECYESQLVTIDNLKRIYKYEHLALKLSFIHQQYGHSRKKDIATKYNHVFCEVDKMSMNVPGPFLEAYYYYYFKGFQSYLQRNTQEVEKHMEIMSKHFNQYEMLKELKPEKYLIHLINYSAMTAEAGKYEFAYELNEQMVEFARKHSKKGVAYKLIYFNHALALINDIASIEAGKAFVSEIEPFVAKYEHEFDRLPFLMLLINLVIFNFGAGKYRKSLSWVNRILNSGDLLKLREDLISVYKIFNIIIHYELGNEEYIPYATRAAYRHLILRDRLHETEKKLLSFFKVFLTGKMMYKSEREIFAIMKESIHDIQNAHNNENLLHEYSNIIMWLESKMTDIPFPDIVRSNCRERIGDIEFENFEKRIKEKYQ